MELEYNTRDGNGNDIVKKIPIKEFDELDIEFNCPICKQNYTRGIPTKKIISSKFTDFSYIGDYVCRKCSRLFSIYPYSYVATNENIKLLNVRQIRDELLREHPLPFKFIISMTQKKHLFYRAITNYSNDKFAVQLETETIYTDSKRMKDLFCFVESLITLGASKKALLNGEIPFNVIEKTGFSCGLISKLQDELQTSREIQIPLFCGQKLEISEEEAICNLVSKQKV